MLNCVGCKIAQGKSEHPFHKVIVNLDDNWILCHSSESHSYLGHLIISTKEHREDWADLTPEDSHTVIKYIQDIDQRLRYYFLAVFNDPMERLYTCYFNDSAASSIYHFHIHLFPRLNSMPKGIAWDIVDIQEQPDFKYKLDDELVTSLMTFLQSKLTPPFDTGYSKDFKNEFVNKYGMPIKNFRDFI